MQRALMVPVVGSHHTNHTHEVNRRKDLYRVRQIQPLRWTTIWEAPLAGMKAELEVITNSNRTSVTRAAVGTVLAGPLGTLIGVAARKNASVATLTVTAADGRTFVEAVSGSDINKAAAFVSTVNSHNQTSNR